MSKQLPNRILALDYGLARIGMALSDESHTIATPLHVCFAERKVEKTVEKIVLEISALQKKFECVVAEVVVGMPLMMSGKKGLQADEVSHFVELLKKALQIPVATWDERLTTVQAERSLRETSMSRKKRSKVIDTVAAVLILQNFLDHKKNDSAKN